MEPECLGQQQSEEAAAAARRGGSRRPKAGGRESTGFSWRGGEVSGEPEKGTQPKKRARKEEAQKLSC